MEDEIKVLRTVIICLQTGELVEKKKKIVNGLKTSRQRNAVCFIVLSKINAYLFISIQNESFVHHLKLQTFEII